MRAPGSCSRMPTQMAPALPGAKVFVLSSRRAATSCVSSQQPTLTVGMTSAPAWHILAAVCPQVTQTTSPNRGGQTRPTQPAPCSRQRDGTLMGLIPGGAQETVLSSSWCLPLAASEERGQLGLSFCSAQQGHPSLMLTDRSHHKAADVLHSCSTCLRKSKKPSSLQQASNYHKPFQSLWQQLCKLRHRMRLPSIPADWAKLAPDSIGAEPGPAELWRP